MAESRGQLEDAFGEDGYAIPGSPAEPSGQKVGDESAKDILGWKTIELNAGQRCCQCGKGLAKGGEAFIAITQAGQEEIKFYCGECKQDLQHR